MAEKKKANAAPVVVRSDATRIVKAARTATLRNRRIARDQQRQDRQYAHLRRWAAKHGVRSNNVPSHELRRLVRDKREPNWDVRKQYERTHRAEHALSDAARIRKETAALVAQFAGATG